MFEWFLVGGLIAAGALAFLVWRVKAGKKGGIPSKPVSGVVIGGLSEDYREFENGTPGR